jgi:uncharacterized ferredoxin-like protein
MTVQKETTSQMFIESQKSEKQAVLNLAYSVCAAVRTAPKACRIDHLETAILAGEDKKKLSDEMRRIGGNIGEDGIHFIRDAENLDVSEVVILVGAKYEVRGIGKMCGLCRFDDCAACSGAEAVCVFTPLDLGIALGSAVALIADNRVDNRIMFTIGKAASSLELLGEYKLIMGIPLSVSGKSPFFDR